MQKCNECEFCKGTMVSSTKVGKPRKRAYYCTKDRIKVLNNNKLIGYGEILFNDRLMIKTSPQFCPLRLCNLKKGLVFE